MREDATLPEATDEGTYTARRRRLVEGLKERIRDERVLEAIQRVPRHEFVPAALRELAYLDRALPIGEGQTISQPQMVAVLLEAAELRGHERVLDVGAGSGYQTALLAELAADVYAIEILPTLARSARRVLERIGALNVTLVQGDGREGYAAAAPYDAILVAAAAPAIPPALIDQLARGGRLLIPIGGARGQALMRIRKLGGDSGAEAIVQEELDLCTFVPLVKAP